MVRADHETYIDFLAQPWRAGASALFLGVFSLLISFKFIAVFSSSVSFPFFYAFLFPSLFAFLFPLSFCVPFLHFFFPLLFLLLNLLVG